jgi:acyl-CoA synthetase (AMP-forming)/AMP-acid ligase II
LDETTKHNIRLAHNFDDKSATDYLVKYQNIYELIEEQTTKHREEEYLVFYDEGGERIIYTYNTFREKVNQLANYLLQNGITLEDRIATFSHNHSDTVILYYACWSIGAVVVPINVNEELDRVKFILDNSHSKMVFTRSEYVSKLAQINGNFKVVNFDEASFEEQSNEIDPGYENHSNKESEAMIIYTSGTTGNPKGVVLTQYNLMADALGISEWHRLYSGDTMMCVLPIHHVNGTVVTIMTTMFYGGRLVLNQKFQTDKFFTRLADEVVKVVSVVPTLLQFLLHSDEDSSKHDLSKFSHIICGAGPLTCEIAKNFEGKFGLRIVHGYGLSETTCYSCFIPVDLADEEHSVWQNDYGFPAIGIPINCNDMAIHDENGNSLGEEHKGEIVIRGHNVMKYYFDNDEVNKKTFEFGWFRSGDEGFFKYDSNGKPYYFITGRLKELIIRGGVNISPLEIDEVLSGLDFVKAGIAVGFDNDWYGEEVGALVILNNKPKDEKEAESYREMVISGCSTKLPFHKAPKVVIISDTIPVTSTGKYQRNKVKHLFADYKAVQFKK